MIICHIASKWRRLAINIAPGKKWYRVFTGFYIRTTFFNIQLCDLSFIIDKFDIVNFADHNTLYVTGDNTSSVAKLLEEVACAIFQ